MAYTIAEDGLGSSAPDVAHADAPHPDHLKVADSGLPFRGAFHRDGSDLHLTSNGVTPDVVQRFAASTSPHQSGDGQPTSLSHPLVGHVGQVVGDATVLRNGVEVPLHVGDAIFKGDVIQTGAASAVGISFPDGTALNLVANSQMAINGYSYEANSAANAAHFTLIDGTFGFVAGKVAHDGDMKISTPVATMVVHGGAGWAHELSPSEIAAISATLGDLTYSFAVVDDRGPDTHGLYDLLLNGTVVSSIDDPHLIWYFDQHGDLISRPLDDADRLFAGDLFHDFDRWLDVNPQSLGIHGSGSPINLPTFPELIDFFQDAPSFNSSFMGSIQFGVLPPFIDIPINRPTSNIFIWNGVGNWDLNLSDWNQGFAPTNANDIVTIQGGKASYSNSYTIASLTVDFGAILNIDGGSLTTSAIDNAGLIQLNASGSDPVLIINGAIDLVGGGAIHMLGPSFDNFILGVPGSGATLINVDNVITGSGNIGDGDHNLSFVNEASVDATPILPGDSGLLTIDTGNAVANNGLFEATGGGELLVGDLLVNSGLVQAVGAGSSVVIDNHSAAKGKTLPGNADLNSGTVQAIAGGLVEFDQDSFGNADNGLVVAAGKASEVEFNHSLIVNESQIVARQHGTIWFSDDRVENDQGAVILAKGRSSETVFDHSRIDNDGTIEARHRGLLTFDNTGIDNRLHGAIEAKGQGSEISFDRGLIANSGLIAAETRGEIEIGFSLVDNDKRGTIEAIGRGSELSFVFSGIGNRGFIGATNDGFLAFDLSLVDNAHSGEIVAVGAGSEVKFDRDLVKNSGLVGAGWGGTVRFDRSLIWNAFTGVIAAVWNSEVKFKHDDVNNSGLVTAAYGGEVAVDKSHVENSYSGTIEAEGWWSKVAFDRSHVGNGGLIEAAAGGLVTFDVSHIRNGWYGVITADGRGSEVAFEHSHVDNSGLISAENRGEVEFDASRVHNGGTGTIEARGQGSEVEFDGGQIDNHGLIEAAHHGAIEFEKAHTENHTQGAIEAKGYGSEIAFDRGNVVNDGLIEARHSGEVSLTGASIHNEGGGTIEALGDGSAVDIAFGDLHNEGLIKAGHGGTVTLSDLTVYNGNGVIDATGSGARVQLADVEIDHGEIKSSNGGLIETVDNSGDSILSDVTIASGSDVSVRNGSMLTFQDGTSMFAGTLSIGESGPGTAAVDIEDNSGVALDGVTVTAFAPGDGIDVGLTHQATLVLEGGTSITGGTLDIGSAHHVGTVDVEGPAGATFDDVTVAAASIKDSIEVTGRATLLLAGGTTITNGTLALGGLHSGNFGTIDVESASGATLDGAVVTAVDNHDGIEVGRTSVASLLLDGGTTITGGSLAIGEAGGTGMVDVEGASGAALHDVMVTGDAIGDNLEVGLTSTSTLTMDSGTTMTGGTLTIGAQGTLQVDPSLAILSGVNLVNHGNIVIDPGAATLTVENDTTITGGNINVGAQGTLDIDGSTLSHVDISDSGVVDIGNNDVFDPSDVLSFVGQGTLNVEGNSVLDLTLAGLKAGDVIDLKGEVVNSAVWNGSALFLNGSQVAFSVSGGLPAGDTFAFKSDGHGGTDLKVAPQILSVSGSPASGIENSPIPISFNTVTGGASLTSFVISGIPAGATLSDGHGNQFAATAQLNSIDVHGWDLSSLTINSTTAGDFAVSALATVTDRHGYSYSALATEAVTVTVPPGPPVFSSASTASVNEGVAPDTIVYTAVSADPQNAPITYSLTGTDASHFAINANSGAVAILTTPSFETQSLYHFNVVASEQGFSAQKAVTIDVNDLSPTFSSPTTAAVNEGSPVSTVVYTAQATEPGGGTLTYSLSGQDAAAFNLNASTGALTLKSAPSYDVQHSYDVVIQANETGGGTLSADQNVTVTVNPVAATFNSPATVHVNEGVPAGTTVYTALASEPGGGSLTYSLVGGLGDDAADFNINAQTGAVSIDVVPNFHIQDVYHFTVEATEQSGLSTTEAVTLDVNNVPLTITAGAAVHFTGGSAPVVLDNAVTVTDDQSPTAQASATVSIAAGFAPGDTLAFNAGTNTETFGDGATIQGNYNSATGVLTLTEAAGGGATPSTADFQSALQSVTYSAGLNDPTNGGSDTSRTIDWSFNDGAGSSNTASSTVTTSHVAPTVTDGNNALSNFVSYLPGSPVILNSGIEVTDNNGVGATLANAQVELLGAQSGDLLSFNNGTDTETFADGATIHGVYQNGTLTLTEATGSSVTPSVADFQAALRTVAYSSTNGDPGIGGTDKGREIYWVVHDGNSTSGTNLVPANPFDDQPVSNGQPTLGLNQLVVEQGVYPSIGGSSTDDSGGIPMGALRTFAGNVVWGGTASAEGQLLPIQQDTALFSLLGTYYGGDGMRTFELPNLSGNVAVGAGANLTLGETFGSDTIHVNQSNLPIQWGGAGAPLSNDEPSLAVNFLINTGGSAPGSASAGSTDVAGDVIQYLGPYVPQGYLAAAGQTLSISEYPALYAAIGTTYGGDGVTTFKLPNLVGATIEGAGSSQNGFGSVSLGAVTGSNQISLTPGNLPSPQGSSLPVTNLHPTVALNYIIDVDAGIYPSSSGAPMPNEGDLGEIMAYAGTLANIPQGWMLAEGQTLPISQYAPLFSLLGTTYGGNGTTTFQLPDLVGRAVEGVGQTYFGQTEYLGEQSGSNSFTLTSQNVGFPTVDTTTVGILTSAEIDSWTNGTGDGNWSTAGNWSQGAAPGQYSIAVSIGSTGSPTVTGSVDLHNVQLQINGNINIANGASLAIDNTVTLSEGNGASITFTGATGELKLGTPSSFNAAIDSFTGTAPDTAHSDAIDLVGLNFSSAQFSESYNPATGLLKVSDGLTSTSFTFNGFSAALDFASDGNGGTLITAQQANSIAVATGTLVDLTGGSNGTVTFAGGTGELKIDNPASFTGHIDGFTGTAPDSAHSDAIDLVGLDYNAAGFHEQYDSNTGVLQVTDGTHTAQFTFDNFAGTLKFASDGHGGTMIFDPPAPTTPAHAVAATTASGDSFNFSFQPAKGAEVPAHFDWSHNTPIESHVLQQFSAWDAQSVGPEVHHQMDLLHSAITLQQWQAHLHSAVILH